MQGKCEVCENSIWKYKCPVCVIKFCSVPCFKIHKSSDKCKKSEPKTDSEEKITEENTVLCEYPTEDTIPPQKLNLLGIDKKVLGDLQNKHLRKILDSLNSSSNPDKSIEELMKEPIFSEFVTHCLAVVEDET